MKVGEDIGVDKSMAKGKDEGRSQSDYAVASHTIAAPCPHLTHNLSQDHILRLTHWHSSKYTQQSSPVQNLAN